MFEVFGKRYLNKVLDIILILTVILASINLYPVYNVIANTDVITIYLIDNTNEEWVGNDSAEMQLVDNTNGHNIYWMTKTDSVTWSVSVPSNAYNITFNRFNQSKTTQWNSWSAGGRDSNNVYYADGSEYGHWGYIEDGTQEKDEENYFHEGDIIYLDVSSFISWKNDSAIMYANFSDATKVENNGNDVSIVAWENSPFYQPKTIEYEIEGTTYAYIVTKKDEGKDVLRFWRGNQNSLWNCSIKLEYSDYVEGYDCIKIYSWDDDGALIRW